MNGLALAYIGDAYYELEIRNYLINKGYTSVNILHNKAVNYTSSDAQAKIIETLINDDFLNSNEIKAFKKGRNQSHTKRRNVDAKTYTLATGFESVIGYLFLNNKKRLKEVVKESINVIESEVI